MEKTGIEKKDTYSDEETLIIDESPELSIGESPYFAKVFGLFPALKNRNYTLYFSGQLISLIGTWLQIVAQGWLVLMMTHSAFLIGVIAALATLPTLLFSLFGGVIVDQFPKRSILIFTQTSAMILALILGLLTVTKIITVWEIGLLAFLLGTVTAIDAPARQSFVPEIVEKDQLQSAIALNSGYFNAARVIGPAFAGFLIALVGTGGAFLLNAASYIAVITALIFIQVKPHSPKKNLRPLSAIKVGLIYSFSHPIIRTLLIFIGVISIFGWSYTTIMPVIAQATFHQNATGLGYLYVASGLGALIATFVVSVYSKRISPLIFILGGNALFAVSLILFSFTTNFLLALVFLFFSGLGLLSQFAMMNTTIQQLVTNDVRGRVMSIYTLMFLGLSPLGNFEIGFVSDKVGTGWAIRSGALIVLSCGTFIFLNRHKISASYKKYQGYNG